MNKIALVAGASGLIGSQLLELLLNDNRYKKVIALSRKPLSSNHPKLENVVMDFDKLAEHPDVLRADDIFCCLGTTMKQAGSQKAFYKVDFEYPLEIAKITRRLGARQYLLVTALGANKKSSIYYNRVKGEIEEAVGSQDFESYHIFRPSFLQGDRIENRPGEQATTTFFKLFGFLVPRKYKAIHSVKVARAMLFNAKAEKSGRFIYESGALQDF
jgi:uncharacterized protein YbjT (DUF2867 family)